MLDAAVTCSKQIRSMKTVNPNVIAYAAMARKKQQNTPIYRNVRYSNNAAETSSKQI